MLVYYIKKIKQRNSCYAPWHFLYFFPLPQGHGSLRPASFLGIVCDTVGIVCDTECPTFLECSIPLSILGPELWISKTDSFFGSAICPPIFKAISAMALSIAASIRIKSPRPSFLYSTSGSFCP